MNPIEIYDCTLRDGTQAEDFNLSVEDKIRIAKKLDELGLTYIEGGWPGSNPKDVEFFQAMKKVPLKQALLSAFGSTHNPKTQPEKDPNLKALLQAQTPVITIFGKSWDVHVRDALRVPLGKNLRIIEDSLALVRPKVSKLFYDAEHFFDGYQANPEYALATLKAAMRAKVDCLILCDTNGGTLPSRLASIIQVVKKQIKGIPLGIHTHNDCDCSVANVITAVECGIRHVQGTINGFGDRCGNADLCSIIPNLQLKLGLPVLNPDRLKKIRDVSRFVDELANIRQNKYQPYVGDSAFSHKGGIHVSAVVKNPETYEHIRPELVGNIQRILVSDLAGRSNILSKAKGYGLDVSSKDPLVSTILTQLKELEHQGFQYEGAEGSFELLMNRAMGTRQQYFELEWYRVTVQKVREDQPPIVEATIIVKVKDQVEHTAALGNGPVNALDNALRKALVRFYPELNEVSLDDYKVRVLSSVEGTGARVRVLIESGDREDKWGTVGVSTDILEASWQALVDSITYKLYKEEKKKNQGKK
ncbi:MAG: citramalate synthase [Deltaproteobacteria bacterium RBG_13_43_22]|nr:MAG: citramalate synthase [Deltaproteobacteria bacterium RBG_13_43_22]